ncbi:MAG: cellulase family glycosylhydrolase [Lachnospiraceae bacterium]|nr:cellulase family glycosylhydrolase [Lachnospiraceae bacterium]
MKYRIHKVLFVMMLVGTLSMGLLGCNQKTDSASTTTVTTQAVSEVSESADVSTTEAKATATTAPSTSDYEITLESNNSWESGGMVCAQFDGLIKNHTSTNGSDWKVTVTVPEGSKLENSWNGNYNLSGTTLVITPVDYNKKVEAGGEIPFGFILDTPQAYVPQQVILDIAGGQYALGEGGSNKNSQEITTEAKEDEIKEDKKEATEETEVATKDTSGTPVANHGALSVKGTNIVDKNGKVFQLKGVSTHGINWFPDYVNKEAFSNLSEYGVNAIRLAMYTVDYNGYCSGGNQADLEAIIDRGVQACTDLGMYVIVDWHILNDLDPNVNKDSAKTFFDKMSKKYAGNDNVIYEICNEPNGGTTWESIKSYAEEIIPIIRKNDKDALIIVGTPNWSQDVDIASNNPIKGQENILYAVHFYAATHKDNIRGKVETAIGNGLPVIVSESSICEASGNGSINYDEGQKWMDLIAKHNLSCFAWSLGNKDETSSFLKASVSKTNGFTKDDFSETGKWYLEQYGK